MKHGESFVLCQIKRPRFVNPTFYAFSYAITFTFCSILKEFLITNNIKTTTVFIRFSYEIDLHFVYFLLVYKRTIPHRA